MFNYHLALLQSRLFSVLHLLVLLLLVLVFRFLHPVSRAYRDWETDSLPDEMARLVKVIITKHRDTKKQVLMTKLRDAEAAGDEQTAEHLRRDLNALIKESV